MPIQRLGYRTERQKERARKAIERIPMMIEETAKTVQRYDLLDDSQIGLLNDFIEAGSILQENLTLREDREDVRN